MSLDEQLETLENEFKLIKGEVRQSLTNVRDFLLTITLPPPQEGEPVASTQEPKRVSEKTEPDADSETDSNVAPPEPSGPPPEMSGPPPIEPIHQKPVPDEPFAAASRGPVGGMYPPPPAWPEAPSGPPQRAPVPPGAHPGSVSKGIDRVPESAGEVKGRKLSEERAHNKPQTGEEITGEAGGPFSKVNLLTNLIRWVSMAVRKLGVEKLSTFLDVYALGGNLNQELKEQIIHLAEVMTDNSVGEFADGGRKGQFSEQLESYLQLQILGGQLSSEVKDGILHFAELMYSQPLETSTPDMRSWLMLELHGILAGGGTLSEGIDTSDSSEETEDQDAGDDTDKSRPASVKLVVATGDGQQQEISIEGFRVNLNAPETDSA
ncbi:MAG TPA: hypothetical protein G4O07_00145 [Dehalococcoidia bacterium]|nr:hypothetical protein [Dehalococcoidia bacterium]